MTALTRLILLAVGIAVTFVAGLTVISAVGHAVPIRSKAARSVLIGGAA